MKRIRIILAAALIACIAAVLLLLDLPGWTKLDTGRITSAAASTVLYDANGEPMHGLYDSERKFASLAEMPAHLPQAFVAAEDARFYDHHGVDLRRIFGALLSNIRTLSFGEGASTITQQLVRMTHLSAEKTLSRKAQEAVLAMQLERRMTKDDILAYYINIAYFGAGAYGAASAAETYFSKELSELTLAESALLAGLVKAPSSYEPDKNPEKALERRAYVLGCMLKNGYITQQEHDSAQNEPLRLDMPEKSGAVYGWYADAVMEEAMQALDIPAEAFLSGGYHVYTAFDPHLQTAADSLFENTAHFPADAADGTPAQAALIAIEPKSGEILCLVGGREYSTRRGLDRATSIRRQPGSAFKPVSVYAAAIDAHGYLPASVIRDEQRDFGGGYSPGNAGGKFFGDVTLRTALSKSLNAASVDLLTRTGIGSARSYAQKLGLPLSKADSGLSLALGALTEGVSPLELCSAYAAIANGGVYRAGHCIRRIENSAGELLYANESEPVRAMSEESACLLTSMLQTAVESGSAQALGRTGFPTAAKTGTVSMEEDGNRDAWIAAYTQNIAVCVWMGFDEPDSAHCIPEGSGGSAYPARLAAAFLSDCKDRADSGEFPTAEGLVEVPIDLAALDKTGQPMLCSEFTPPSQTASELFRRGNEPTMVSNVWQAPSMVWDLSVVQQDGHPVIRFTAEENAGYRVYRTTGEKRTEIAQVVSSAAEPITIVDGEADPEQQHRYSVVPFHAALAEENIDLCGTECLPVLFSARPALWEWIDPQPEPVQPHVMQQEPLFTGNPQ